MLRFLLVPLVVIQLFMVLGYPAGGSNASDISVGWDPNGSNADTSSENPDASPGWDPDGSNAETSSDDSDVRLGWDPNG